MRILKKISVVSKGIVDGHGGDLSVFSSGEGLGSTFTLRLPLEQLAADSGDLDMSVYNVPSRIDTGQWETDTSTPTFPLPSIDLISGQDNGLLATNCGAEQLPHNALVPAVENERKGGIANEVSSESSQLTILIVDDSTLNRKMTAKMFAKTATCDQAADGQIAVDMFMAKYSPLGTPSSAYDVILMDYQMPNMDGPTAIRELRRLGFRGLIFGLTGNAIECDKMEMMAAGADKVFIKPFDTGMFWEAVKTNWKH